MIGAFCYLPRIAFGMDGYKGWETLLIWLKKKTRGKWVFTMNPAPWTLQNQIKVKLVVFQISQQLSEISSYPHSDKYPINILHVHTLFIGHIPGKDRLAEYLKMKPDDAKAIMESFLGKINSQY